MSELICRIDGTDEIHVKVENGIEFDGIITAVRISGDYFYISGYYNKAVKRDGTILKCDTPGQKNETQIYEEVSLCN